jgi:tetratricopeptide (TPR) repeat protein
MAKPFLCRLGVAQISCNPAYADELVACLQEPAFPAENEKVGLFTISGLEEVSRLRQNISEQYIAHLNRKVESIVRFAAGEGVELLVFPEYSIPAESLPLCHALSEELGIAVIAGSHVVTVSQSAQQAYRGLELTFAEGANPVEEHVRQAACIAFVPKQKPVAFVKYVRSKWETCLVKGAPAFHAFQMTTKKGRIEVQVLICIEALSGKPPKEKHTMPRLIAVTAFTPKADPFHDEGKRALLQGKCTLFANVAEFGGSEVFARADNTSLWFAEKDGSKAIPKGSEALLIMEADLEKQFEVRQLAREHTAVADLRLYPILYATDSAEAQQYSDIRDVCASTNPALGEIGAQVSPFMSLTQKIFPRLLQEKLAHFTGHIAPSGTISPEEAIKWITPIVIRDIPSTDGLRWELCNQAIEAVNGLLLSGKYLHKAEELSKVYMHLLSRRNELAASIQPSAKPPTGTQQLKLTARPAAVESPFIDRETVFDRIRQFFNQQQNSAFVLGGMRGIGKSALVQEAFRQAIPPRKRIQLQMTEGISYQRLLAELAFECNLRIPETLDLSKATTQDEVKKRVVSYLGQGPGAVVVFDDFQFLLNASGEIEDTAIRELLLGLIEASQSSRTKYFLISNVSPRLGPKFESSLAFFKLQGLQPRDTERLLVQWLQFGRDDLAGHLPTPSERLISTLGGHPLATKVAARLWAEHPTTDIAEEFSIFKELRDTIVSFILEKLTLSPPEKDLLSFASIFRLPVAREVFLNWRKEDASLLLSSLAGQYLIEASERGYQLHPLIRSFFRNMLSFEQAKELHRVAGKFYLNEFERIKKTSKQIVPEYLGEAVHHFLAAGDRNKVKDFAFYGQELKPVALEHYRRGDHKTALRDYELLLELDKNDWDAHFHLSLIFARMGRWPDAELHFGNAIKLRPRAYWILQAYGAAKLRGGKLAEGEALLQEAEEINPNHSPTLVELGRLREKQRDMPAAEEYYRRAIDADQNNSYAYYRLAELLYHEGEIQQAFDMANAALATNPLNDRNKELVQQIKRKIAGQS